MKKIILPLCVAMFTFSLAVAQQNQLFDLQKHLQEKLKEEQKQKKLEQNPFQRKAEGTILITPQNPPQAKLSNSLPDGSNIYLLPLDNMPCVEPDMKKYDAMPNLSSQKRHQLLPDDSIMPKQLGNIPNLSDPQKWNIIPDDNNK